MTDDPFAGIVLFPEIGQPTWVELIIATYTAPRTHLHRELADPSLYARVLELALAHGIHPTAGYTPYRRNVRTHALEHIDWRAQLETGMSILVVPANIPADGFLRVYGELASRSEILPSRMLWP